MTTITSRRHLLAGAGASALLGTAGCAAPADPAATAIDAAVAAPSRSARLRARDAARHPAAELAFMGVQPDMTVVEIWPGGGYWTEILAPLLHDRGTYYLAVAPDAGLREERHFTLSPALGATLASDPAVYGRVRLTTFGASHPVPAPPGSADRVLTFRNLHNWMADGDAPALLAGIRDALKPDGVLGIEEHRARPDQPQDPGAADGYVRQDYATALIERAGFRRVASSEIEANPRDTTHWPRGVWTLPPALAMGAVDRARYEAVGEADNFVMLFRKA